VRSNDPHQLVQQAMLDNPYPVYQAGGSLSALSGPYLAQPPHFMIPAREGPSLMMTVPPYSPMPQQSKNGTAQQSTTKTVLMSDAAFANTDARIKRLDINDTGDGESRDVVENVHKDGDSALMNRKNTGSAIDSKTKILKSKAKDVKPRRRANAKAAAIVDMKIEHAPGQSGRSCNGKPATGKAGDATETNGEDAAMSVDEPNVNDKLVSSLPSADPRQESSQRLGLLTDPRDCSSAAEALLNLRRH
jgi:hypothetical protein